ncbi:MAG: pyruvate kinase alpha/beta domain-containing protein [Candidatus Helarchaeota archaeon]
MESKIYYFEKAGIQNTDDVLKIAKQRADEKNLKTIIIASTSGATALKAMKIFNPKEYNLIAVTHASYFIKNNYQELLEENKKQLLENGVKVVTGVHALSGIGRSYKSDIKPPIWSFTDLLGRTFRSILGDGYKVCIEICLMAVDAGLITLENDVISIGGKGRGSDTALILKPASTSNFLDLKIKEIICKPNNF